MNIKKMNEFEIRAIVENIKNTGIKTEIKRMRSTMSKDEFERYANETYDNATLYSLRGFSDKFEIVQTKENLICVEVIIHTPYDVSDLQEFYDNLNNKSFIRERGLYKTIDEIKKLYKQNRHAIYVKGFGMLEKDNFEKFEKEFSIEKGKKVSEKYEHRGMDRLH